MLHFKTFKLLSQTLNRKTTFGFGKVFVNNSFKVQYSNVNSSNLNNMEIDKTDSSSNTKRELENSDEGTTKRAKTQVDPKSQFTALVTEDIVGIRCCRTTTPGFSAIFKQRWSDFHVNEVDLQGNVVHLTDMTKVPVVPEEEVPDAKPDLIQVIGEEQFAKLEEFANASDKTDKKAKFTITNITNKDDRTKVHKGIRALFTGVISETADTNITVCYGKGTVRDKAWPKGLPNYLQFYLYKEHKDTTEAINVLCGLLKMSKKSFSLAGTKDKRGITVQRVTVSRIKADRMRQLNRILQGMKVGNFSYVEQPLKLGDLYGNRFGIILRDVSAEDEIIKEALSQLGQNGFYNYYGLQRFGTREVLTHQVGIELLAGNWEKAVGLILDPVPSVHDPNTRDIRALWRTDPKAALAKFPRYLVVERYVLQGFKGNFKNYLNAIQNLPRTMGLMYVHAFQSFVWNHMLSIRMEQFGPVPVPGDFVYAGNETTTTTSNDKDETVEEEMMPEEETVEEKMVIKQLKEEDIKSGKYTIFDVVLPIPGFSVEYPPHLEKHYGEFMQKYGVDYKNMKRSQKDYSLPGGYRKIVEKVEGLSWDILRYDDFKTDLMLSDVGRIENKTLATPAEGKHKALRVEFTLRSACYATMVVREILKSSTSQSFQRSLNTAFAAKDQ